MLFIFHEQSPLHLFCMSFDFKWRVSIHTRTAQSLHRSSKVCMCKNGCLTDEKLPNKSVNRPCKQQITNPMWKISLATTANATVFDAMKLEQKPNQSMFQMVQCFNTAVSSHSQFNTQFGRYRRMREIESREKKFRANFPMKIISYGVLGIHKLTPAERMRGREREGKNPNDQTLDAQVEMQQQSREREAEIDTMRWERPKKIHNSNQQTQAETNTLESHLFRWQLTFIFRYFLSKQTMGKKRMQLSLPRPRYCSTRGIYLSFPLTKSEHKICRHFSA